LTFAVLLFVPAAAFAQPFVAQPLVTPDGYQACTAMAVNLNGVVAGVCRAGSGKLVLSRAVAWRDGVPVELPLPPGYAESWAENVNDSGTIVGTCAFSLESVVACVWTPAGAVQVLPTPDGESSEALDINASGLVAGWSGVRAVVWTPAGVVSLPGGEQYRFATAYAINDSGVVAVRAADPDVFAPTTALRWWTDTGTVSALPIPAGYTLLTPRDINAHDDVVGSLQNSSGSLRPVLWLNGVPQLLSEPAGLQSALAVGVNDSLDVSGHLKLVDGTSQSAALWLHDGTLVSFDPELIPGKASATANFINNARVAAGSSNGVATLFAPQTAAQAAEQIADEIEQLITVGAIQTRDAAALESQISAAVVRIADGNNHAAIGVLTAFNNRVAALVNSGRLTQADASNLVAASNALIERLN
jgi:uncharacterized membrane protein